MIEHDFKLNVVIYSAVTTTQTQRTIVLDNDEQGL